jgi:hypothetical protein
MNRAEKKAEFGVYYNAALLLQLALRACDREAKAKNGKARRKARSEATESLLNFWFWLCQIQDSLPKALHKIADAMDGKLRWRPPIRYDDKYEEAVVAIFGGRNTVGFLVKAPFSLREFKQNLARIRGVKPKDLWEPDSLLRRTLKRRGYTVSGKTGRPKNSPRLTAE